MRASVPCGPPPDPASHIPAALPPELCLHRDRCIALLRRYFKMSVELGRLPALLGREFFRARTSSFRTSSFEDAVIFVHDVERCLQQLAVFDQQLIARCVLQEYTRDEAARLLRCTRQTVQNRLPEAIDACTAMLLDRRLLAETPRRPLRRPVTTLPEASAHDLRSEREPLPGVLPRLSGCGFPVVKPPSVAFFS